MGPFLPAGPSLEKWGLKHYGSILRHQTTFLGVKLCHYIIAPCNYILHAKIFLMAQEARQLESVCKSYAN